MRYGDGARDSQQTRAQPQPEQHAKATARQTLAQTRRASVVCALVRPRTHVASQLAAADGNDELLGGIKGRPELTTVACDKLIATLTLGRGEREIGGAGEHGRDGLDQRTAGAVVGLRANHLRERSYESGEIEMEAAALHGSMPAQHERARGVASASVAGDIPE